MEPKSLLSVFLRHTGVHSVCPVCLVHFRKRIGKKELNAGKKIYSIHEPEVQCISKGTEHRKYEFGNKVSVIRYVTDIILGFMSFRNEYDGHTIESS